MNKLIHFSIMLYKRLLPVFFVIFLVQSASAQTGACITKLKDAGLRLEEGRNDEAIDILKDALQQCNFNSDDKIAAHKALILAYFQIDDLESAEKSAEAIVKINPNYKADKLRDPAEMIALFEKYKPKVVFRAGFSGGINIPSLEASNTYSVVANDNTSGLVNYESVTGFQIGLVGEYRLWKSLWVTAGASFRRSGYKNSIPNVEGRTIFYEENLNYIDVPVGLSYFIGESKLQPYLRGGVQLTFLTSAVGQLSRDDISDLVDRNNQREEFVLGLSGGAGLAYQHQNFSFRLGADYMLYTQNVNKEGTRYENLESIFRYYYLDNDFTINFIQVTAGVVYNLGFKTKR